MEDKLILCSVLFTFLTAGQLALNMYIPKKALEDERTAKSYFNFAIALDTVDIVKISIDVPGIGITPLYYEKQ